MQCCSYKLGHSTEGRELLCCRLGGPGQGPAHHRPLLRPMVKLVANIHGDEAVGREMLCGLVRSDQYSDGGQINIKIFSFRSVKWKR